VYSLHIYEEYIENSLDFDTSVKHHLLDEEFSGHFCDTFKAFTSIKKLENYQQVSNLQGIS